MIIEKQFINPHMSCHASSIEHTPKGLLATFFAGVHEGHPHTSIWLARKHLGPWKNIEKIAQGEKQGRALPCWNPVLFQFPNGPLFLFYKVGATCSGWWGMFMQSNDCGDTWSNAQELPQGIFGPIKNKPVLLSNGTLLCPSSTEKEGWRAHVEYSTNYGQTWSKSASISGQFAAIQPTILLHNNGNLQMLCRTQHSIVATSYSQDQGKTWSPMRPTNLPNPNSAVDAVTLHDKRFLLVYNYSAGHWGPRTPLNVAISENGVYWEDILVLEKDRGEYSYPAVIQDSTGKVHITYTWQRKQICHVVLDSTKF